MRSFCLIMVKYHPKQRYIILFQENFIPGMYIFQEDRYLILQTSQDFYGHCILYSDVPFSNTYCFVTIPFSNTSCGQVNFEK